MTPPNSPKKRVACFGYKKGECFPIPRASLSAYSGVHWVDHSLMDCLYYAVRLHI